MKVKNFTAVLEAPMVKASGIEIGMSRSLTTR